MRWTKGICGVPPEDFTAIKMKVTYEQGGVHVFPTCDFCGETHHHDGGDIAGWRYLCQRPGLPDVSLLVFND